jgi:hypothetical protein
VIAAIAVAAPLAVIVAGPSGHIRVLPYRERVVWTSDIPDWHRSVPTANGVSHYTLTLRRFGPLEGGIWALRVGLTASGDPERELLDDTPGRGCPPYIETDQLQAATKPARPARCRRQLVLHSRAPHNVTVRITNVTTFAERDGTCIDCESLRRVEMDVAIDPTVNRRRRPTTR